jgi:hypothetical protein
MYDPEASFTANTEFDKMAARVEQFAQTLRATTDDLPAAIRVGDGLKQAVELLRHQYDEYLNEFDPDKKAMLHKRWHAKVDEFLAILKGMAEQL